MLDNLTHHRTIYVNPDYNDVAEFMETLPERFDAGEGEVIYKGRNEIRLMKWGEHNLVVKSFTKPYIINRIAYGILRGSKAKRSYLNAQSFLSIGVGSPQPVAYMDVRDGILLDKSYYVSLMSPCPYVYEDLFSTQAEHCEVVCREIGRITAILHNNGFAHKDYGRRNILFKIQEDGKAYLEIVDLNRMTIGKIGFRDGCQNFERLPATPQMQRWMAEEYAAGRGFDADECYKLIVDFRKKDKGTEEI